MRAVFALLVLASAAQAQFDMCQFIPQCTISQCSEPFTVRGGSDSACTSYDGVIESWSNVLPQFEKCGRDWSQFWCNLIEAYFDDFEGNQCQTDESMSLAPCKESCEDIMWDCTNDDFWVEHMCSGFRSEGSGLCYPMAMDNDDDPEDGDEEFPDGPDLPDFPDFPGGFPDLDGGLPLRQSAIVQKKPTSRRDCSQVATTFCPMIYAPVCGSDGVTYGNTCEFGKAQCFNPNLAVSFTGSCEDSAVEKEPAVNCDDIGCPAVWEPVCGSDLHTYSNACEFGRAQCKDASLSVSFTGECPEVQHQKEPAVNCDEIMCPMVWAPVCGSDLHTYGNECEFGKAQCKDASLSVSFTGECPEMQHQQQQEARDCDDIMCPMVWAPVCGSDMHTYGNDCEFGRAQCKDASLSMSFTGECPETEPAPMCEEIVCPKILDPVCASDGITYSNPCILSIAQCRDPTLAVAFMGECEGVLGGIAGADEDSESSEPADEDRPNCIDCLDMFEAGHASCQAFETNCLSTGGQSCSFRAMRCIRDIDESVRACSAECIAN